MSFDALAWAAKQKPGNLAAKMVLLALANYAGETGLAFPSTAAIADFGDMNHKTATAALDRLEALGLIVDTGKKAGRSGQIKVYRLNLESLPKTEASQKRKPPVFSAKDPQKRVTDTVREPVSSEAKASSDVRASDDCQQVVEAWNAMAKNAGLSSISKLTDERRRKLRARIRSEGLDAIRAAIERIPKSPFLTGQTKDWKANFEFLLRTDSVTKINEGNYDGKQPGVQGLHRPDPLRAALDAAYAECEAEERDRAASGQADYPGTFSSFPTH